MDMLWSLLVVAAGGIGIGAAIIGGLVLLDRHTVRSNAREG
jgi:hypothetical protein